MANGEGEHIWASGEKYQGNWKNGKMNGNGIMVYSDGTTKMGTWKDGEYVPCDCKVEKITPMLAYEQSDAVMIGVVTNTFPIEGNTTEYIVQFEILKYWKGALQADRTFYVKAGFTSCDILFEMEKNIFDLCQ